MKRQLSSGNAAVCANKFELVDQMNVLPSCSDEAPIKSLHKMSVPIVSVPSSASRSRLASFNLPLFSAAPKNMNFFTSHRRRGSVGKSQQTQAAKCETGLVETVIDMENERAKDEIKQTEAVTDSGEEATSTPVMTPSATDVADAAVMDGQEDISSLHREEVITNKQTHQSTQPSVANSSFPEASGLSRQRSREVSSPDDAATLQRTERGLLNLLEDFNAGRLRAFGASDASAALRRVRDMQERLARTHFDFCALQEKIGYDNPKLANLTSNSWQTLMLDMEELTNAVQRLGASSDVSHEPGPDPTVRRNETEEHVIGAS